MTPSIFLIFILLLLNSFDSGANLRAPKNISRHPSSTLYPLTRHAKVLREQMNIECDWAFCEVSVKYLIEAQQDISAFADFILPKKTKVSVKVGKNAVAVQKKAIPYGKDPLFKASFPFIVAKGQHEILINYRQSLSQQEVGYGYFSKGYFIGVFQYELWPLNEWQVAPDFNLDLIIKLKAELLGNWWDRLFNQASIYCFTTTFNRCDDEQNIVNEKCKTVTPLKSLEKNNPSIVKINMDAPLPDRLFCKISPE